MQICGYVRITDDAHCIPGNVDANYTTRASDGNCKAPTGTDSARTVNEQEAPQRERERERFKEK